MSLGPSPRPRRPRYEGRGSALPYDPGVNPLRTFKTIFESLVTGLAAIGYVLMVWGVLLNYTVNHVTAGPQPIARGFVGGSAFLAATLIQWPFVLRVVLSLARSQHPAVLAAALQTPVRHPLLRVVGSLWWLVHFAALTAFTIVVAITATPPGPPDPVLLVVLSLFTLLPTYTAFGFLLMAVAVWPVGPERLIGLWDRRAWVAMVVTLVGSIPILLNALIP